MTDTAEKIPNSGRKLFFGLFIFPLLIAVGMAVLLCAVVLLTTEEETPETLIASIKTGSPSKRWQKAFELSNELNRQKEGIRTDALMREVISVLRDPARYDSKTRGYTALALSHFRHPEAVAALRGSLKDADEDVLLYSLWGLGVLGVREAATELTPLLTDERIGIRRMTVYVLGVIGDRTAAAKLRSLTNDPDPDIRWNAALSLARLGDDGGFEVLKEMTDRDALADVHELSEETTESVMKNAIRGLTLIPKPESITILESLSRNDKSLKVRQAAIDALAAVGASKSAATSK